MDSAGWDQRYRESDLLWSAGPNRFVEERVADLPPGTAVDLAAGEGRNAIWLAERGWDVTAVDFSPVGLDKGRQIAQRRGVSVEWVEADATTWSPSSPVDLVLVVYLHLPPPERRAAHLQAARAVAPGGLLLVLGHDLDNLERGVGGPPDPDVLLTHEMVVDDLDGTGLAVEEARQVTRVVDVDGTPREAIDCVVMARRPR